MYAQAAIKQNPIRRNGAYGIVNRRVQAYLGKTRYIDFEVINHFIKHGFLYESADKHEVVFLSKDKNDVVKYASKRSTLTNSSFRQDISNSNKEYGFKMIGESEKVFVFESPIDLLSHATISKVQGYSWKKDSRVSLGGVSDIALKKFLEENKNIEEIILFLDNDAVGVENANKICKKYEINYKVSIFRSKHKDLNETLVELTKVRENKDIRLKDYIMKVNSPFIESKIEDNEKLKTESISVEECLEEDELEL